MSASAAIATEVVDPALIVTWPQAVVAIVLIIAVLVWPGWLSFQTMREAKQKAGAIEKTLTTTNGGSTVKDALNRIESDLGDIKDTQKFLRERQDLNVEHVTTLLERVEALEGRPQGVLALLTRRR